MRIGTHGRLFLPESAIVVLDILQRMEAMGLVPVVERSLAVRLGEAGHPLPAHVEVMATAEAGALDLLISLGGDGSFLDSVAFVGRTGVPVLGINLGRLGFLSNTRVEDVDATLAAVKARRYTIEERGMLALEGCEGFGDRTYALNEVSVHKRDSATMIAIHAQLDGAYLNTYWADGLIVATPTGSTAYSLSCGGPLLDPACDAMVVTPISPHNLNVRPFVVPGPSTIRLNADARGDKYLVNLDSRSVTLDRPRELLIRRADHRVKLAHLEGQAFLNTLRTKLAWGLDVRSAPMAVKAND
ncbi:MAG: NAD kinase [Bacteroidetes bacterium]|nr:NAD kinase [Bacteroidota bacterium]